MSKRFENFKITDLGVIAIVAGLYFLAAKLGLSLAFLNASVSPVWPPTGVAIALVFWLGYRSAPGVLLGALIANYSLTDVSLATAVGISIGNTLEAITAVYLVRRFGGLGSPFNRATNVLKFVVFAAILSTAISATIGNVSLCLGSAASWSNFGRLWLTWWSGDAVGALVITPLILSWVEKPIDPWRGWRLLEAGLLLVLLSLVSVTIYTNLFLSSGSTRPLGHVTIPLLLWAAFRFGPRGVSTAMAALSAIAIWGTINGYGGFAVFTKNDALLYLQAYLANLMITTLSLAAIITERTRAERDLGGSLTVTRILAESPALTDALPRILQRICNTFGWEVGAMWVLDTGGAMLRCLKVWPSEGPKGSKFEAITYERTFSAGVGLPGRVWKTLKPAWIPDVMRDDNFPRAPGAAAAGLHAAFAFPILSGDKFLGVMEFFSHEIREPDKTLLATFRGIGSQIGQFVERKQSEQELFESRERLIMAMQASGMGTWTRELDGTNRVQWSPELEAIFGLAPGEFPETEEAFFEFVHLEDRESLGQAVSQAIANRTEYEVDFRYATRDGKPGWMIGRGRAFYDANGKPYRLAGLGWDITERKRAEEALRESQTQLANLIGSAMDAIITIDGDQCILIFNAAAEKMFGCSAREAIGQPIDRFIPARFRSAHREHIQSFGDTRVTKRSMGALGALFGYRADGEEFPIEASISQIELAGQKLYTVILRDITERKRAEEERERLIDREHAARTEAEEANRIKDEFLATLSHELRTPLTAMLGWLTILRKQRLDKETTEQAIETIERNARAQAKLIEELVDVSRIVGGKLILEMHPTSLLQVIEAAVEVVRPAASAKGVQIRLSADSSVGLVLGDATRLQQIIWNLLSNAVKFTPRDGSVHVSMRRAESCAEVIVQDNGMGISPDFLPYVFERFRQAESPMTRSHRGLGLGLAIVRHLTELHGGTVSAESPGQGRGATFTVRIPLAAMQSDKTVAHLFDKSAVKGEGTTRLALAGVRVLVVEDEPDARALLSLILKSSGATVAAVESAQEALTHLQVFKPDVLLSDIGLPVESGYELIRKVRSLPSEAGKIPAVALTAFATEDDRQLALAAGFHVHLTKPVESGVLVEAIERLVRPQSDFDKP